MYFRDKLWLVSSLPVVSPSHTIRKNSDITTVVVFTLVIGGAFLRRRRFRARTVQLRRISYDGLRNQSLNQPKPSGAPVPAGYPVYYQATPPAPPPAHIPQYPPQGYDTYQRNSRSQWPSSSNLRPIPGPVAPVSPISPRAPSSVTSRPISSLEPSLRSSVRQDESITSAPRSPAAPSSPSSRSAQRNVVESPLSPPPPSPQTRGPSAMIPPPASGAIPSSNTTRPFALSPMNTGVSNNNIDEAPPPYTPI